MKNKKRVLLVALVITTLLAGCGESKQIVSNKNKVTTEKKEEDTSQDNTVGFSTKGTIEPTVMYEENDVKITAESLTYENNMVTLTTAIENNSEKSLSFSCETLGYSCNAVNGYMIENGWMSCDLEAGGKTFEEISFSREELLLHGMSGVAEIVVGFSITDEEYNDVHTGPITIKTSLADEYDYSKESYYNVVESGVLSAYGWTVDYAKKTELYNKNNVKISSPILISNEDGEKMLLLEVENNLEMGIHVITRNISANGVTLYDSLWSSSTINAGKKYVLGLKLSSMLDETTLEEQGITEIEDVTFSLEMEDENNNTLSLPETVSVSVK